MLGIALVFAVPADAGLVGSVTYTDSFSLLPTNWSDLMTIPKWDPSLYPGSWLASVYVELDGHVQGSAAFENEDTSPAIVTMDLSAILRMNRPDGSVLVLTIPVTSTSDNATAYDGITDFAGTSGKTYPSLSADKSENDTHTSAGDLALFTGSGNISLPILANGASTGSGGGNLSLQFSTSASTGAKVVYNYIPEPMTMSLLSIGGLALLRRKR